MGFSNTINSEVFVRCLSIGHRIMIAPHRDVSTRHSRQMVSIAESAQSFRLRGLVAPYTIM